MRRSTPNPPTSELRVASLLLGKLVLILGWGISVLPPATITAKEKDPAPRSSLQPLDLFEFEFATDPQISPSGDRVVYVRQYSHIKTDRRHSNLWIADSNGENHRPLTQGPHNHHTPRWSPSGDRVAYLSNENGSPQIFVLWMNDRLATQVTRQSQPPGPFSWSPDGKHFAFCALVPEKGPTIAKLPTPPKGATWSDPAIVIDRLVYRFDKRGYLTRGYSQLFVVPANGGTARQLTQGPFHHGGPLFSPEAPTWTPDGSSLILTCNRNEDFEKRPLETDLFEVSVKDRKVTRLTTRKGPDSSPTISPDGTMIAYLGFEDRKRFYQVTRLTLMNRDGSGSRDLTGDFDRSVSSPRFSGDGKGIYFLYDQHGNSRLALLTLDGALRDLVQDVGVGGTAYSRAQYSVSPEGVYAFPLARSFSFGEIAVGQTKKSKRNPTRIVASVNRDLFQQRAVAEVEEIWYRSSKDGREIQGWIMKPPGFDENEEYPLILEIHGGPVANYGDRFDIEKQLWAARGYVIFYANPRGSTSYGEEFGDLIHHAYPGDDFYDLDAGVDAVVDKGWIDEEQLFVTGGSGGGVLTCWTIGRTTRYRAAATAYPVIDWSSFTLTTDISAFVAENWFPGMPWEVPGHYQKRSLLSVVENVKTPTMVITGEEDYRTPISESEQYYQALKLLDVETVLVRFPGEPHGIKQRPSHHLSKIAHIVGWFDRFREEPAVQ